MVSPWMRDVCGPTTVHLRHEGYLLLSLGMLTAAAFQSVYGEEFGTRGDYTFLFFTVVWLSRYILIRWLCTWDPSTSANPVGFAIYIYISFCILDPVRLTSTFLVLSSIRVFVRSSHIGLHRLELLDSTLIGRQIHRRLYDPHGILLWSGSFFPF